ncbi:glycerol-3-phosphate dehydrogenase [Pararhizobium antarcticum]|uniref:Glycerol-3-phosphate dehydrogenase n=1 Tax=Pararhizobium antarcticum TaxID=1798805 RepID=A0A657LP41_9HYPH|nr:glycerol-3-phosphate dehydrogenase [Pararhizobium antarcticum]OJF91376.1 glycerol-3-phosphate dehydrogenase [Rhizobium sp. 58]OJF93792.1 glycerol-3-phosphate dehydrogenase [Pararhizobium antarcticum]
MGKIVIIGAGVMGSSLAVPAADNGHQVLLVGSPLDGPIIERLRQPGGIHPKLDAPLSHSIEPLAAEQLEASHLADADCVVAGVSSPGIAWITEILQTGLSRPCPVAFVTKGLDEGSGGLCTYADTLPDRVAHMSDFIGIGGPCIARELANRQPTASVYASSNMPAAQALVQMMQTSYYRLGVSPDVAGVEACAALKNFFAIGVSAMQTRYRDDTRPDGQAKNPTAFVFTLAVAEMARLTQRLGGQQQTAYALAGVGDLHVTVGGGRNSRLGHGLGTDRTVGDLMASELAGETVEGIDTARMLAQWFRSGAGLSRQDYPLATAIIDAVLEDRPFRFDFSEITFG